MAKNLLAQVPLIKSRRIPIPNGDAGIARTVQHMIAFAQGDEGAGHPSIRALATQITRNLASRDYLGEITAVFNWVKQNIRFSGEFKETLQTPYVTVQLATGDCDDFSTLVAALLLTLGYQVRFKTVGVDGPDFSHVYVEVKLKRQDKWVPLDTTVPSATVGWEPPNIVRAKTWTAMGNAGLGDFLGAARRRRLGDPAADRGQQAADLVKALDPIQQALALRIAGKGATTANYRGPFGVDAQFSSSDGIPTMWVLGGGVALVLAGMWLGGPRRGRGR
ncbi:MAG: transglutaminase domain-containing protein [Terriglobales bacterium]